MVKGYEQLCSDDKFSKLIKVDNSPGKWTYYYPPGKEPWYMKGKYCAPDGPATRG